MTDNIRTLMRATAVLEGIAGIVLVVVPSFIVPILLNASLDDPIAVLFARLLGAALITIAIACWLSKTHRQSSLMTIALIGYNLIASCVFVYAALVEEMAGPGLWPCVALHVGLLIWCLIIVSQGGGRLFTQAKMKPVAGRKTRSAAGYQEPGEGDNWKTSARIVKMKDVPKPKVQKN